MFANYYDFYRYGYYDRHDYAYLPADGRYIPKRSTVIKNKRRRKHR